jgi:hypothetical protein
MIFIANLIACSTCFRHHYAHRQELESIIQMVAACGIWCFCFQVVGMEWSWGLCVRFAGSAPHHIDNLKTKAPNNTGINHLYNTLDLLMMGIMVPETFWASNKICNKNHLLHLVGILFPHIEIACLLENLVHVQKAVNPITNNHLRQWSVFCHYLHCTRVHRLNFTVHTCL